MRRPGVLVGLLVCAVSATSSAFVPPAPGRFAADELTAMPAAGLPAGKGVLRTVRELSGSARVTAAWTKFATAAGGTWSVAWDCATGVPTRIWGSGIAAPGANASPAIAEQVARTWLAAHLALLAPGAAPTDFVLVSNTSDGDIRSVGFTQHADGRAVLGGQIGFEFKRDRLFVIGSTALPNVRITTPTTRLSPTALRARAAVALRDQLGLPDAPISTLGAEVVVPLVTADAVVGYRIAAPLVVDGRAAGHYAAYVDVTSGQPIAVRQQDMFATGTVIYHGVDRYPSKGRIDLVAPRAHIAVAGAPATTDHDGHVTWSPDAVEMITTAVVGDLVTVVNNGTGGLLASAMLPITPGGSVTWDASAVPEDDAQLITYLSANQVKDFVRAHIDAQMPSLEDPLIANTNIAQDCNAFYDGKAVNFFHASTQCENTGRIADVVYHEFGHALHTHEIIPGVGSFDGGMSEGVADFLATNLTNDNGLGRGFFYNDKPLRDLDPVGTEATWPRDIGEIHTTGKIFGGTWWDLRKAAFAALGPDAGEALVMKLYVGALRRSVDIPSSLVETLATDDDDGDLSNGTPHECMIRTAYAAHGMHTTTGLIEGPGVIDHDARSIQVRIALSGRSPRCDSDAIAGVTIAWGDGQGGVPAAGTLDATAADADHYYAQMPLPTNGAGSYFATVQFAQGSTISLPDNRADPRYEVYQAHTVPLYCTDFESGDPLGDDWSTAAGSGQRSPWVWAVPDGTGATDPPAAYSGTHALVQAAGGDYDAQSFSSVTMPVIDVGQYSDVRLQYRRWLAVEDSQFDQAKITANGKQVWENATASLGNSSNLQHIDKEWRFHDVPLSGLFTGRKVQVSWQLTADGGLQFGGWALDDVCIVANPDAICGDGVKTITEQCDNGSANGDTPDACRTSCEVARCGDGIVDSGEDCDAGDAGSPSCSASCKAITLDPGGGCAAGGAPGAGLVLALGALLLRRRRA